MSDLVSRSELVKELNKYCGNQRYLVSENIREIINNQPIAYFVEKVVEKLEEIRAKKTCNKEKCDTKEICRICVVDDAIEIVKQGGVGKEREAEEYNGGWISVKDRLPDKAGSYLVIGKSGGATVTRWYMPSEFYPEGHFGGNSADYIRYWMPRPEPPKERD